MQRPVPPDGFELHSRAADGADPWDTLYSRVLADRVIIGFYLRESQINARGMLHSGLLAELADNAMGLSCMQVMRKAGKEPEGGPAIISMSSDFIGTVSAGQWVAVDTRYVKADAEHCFAQAFVTAGGEVIARADARFRVL